MMHTYISEQINARIQAGEDGAVYVTSDFADLAGISTVRKCLGRLTDAGVLRRILDGVYEKPRYSAFLQEHLPVDPELVAHAIARNYHWNISPGGDIVLNKLGLSTQVPVVWMYISDGPYREYSWDNVLLQFRHRTNRRISGMSDMTVMVIEAMRTLGKDRVDDGVIAILRSRLSQEHKEMLREEIACCPEWIREVIREVCR